MGDLNKDGKDPKDTKDPNPNPGNPNPPANSGTPPAGAQNTDKEPGPVPYARFKEINDELKGMRDWKAQQEAAEAKRKKDAEKAEEERLAEQQKYQQLAETREVKLKELEPKLAGAEGRNKVLEDALTAYYTKEIEGVPEHIRGLLEPMPIEKRLEWLSANKAALQAGQTPAGGGAKVPPTPAPGGGAQGAGDGASDKARAEARRFVRNRF